jgi:membrane protease YdiL (CAAX protease family)
MFVFLVALLIAMPLFGIGFSDLMTITADHTNPRALPLLRYLQSVQSIGLFIVPSLAAGYLFTGDGISFAGLHKMGRLGSYLITLFLIVAMTPFINWTIALNESMNLPSFLAGIEEWMTDMEQQATELTNMFMSVETVGGLMVNILVIAVLPAIGEELLFRGVGQRLLNDWLKNIHVAIFLSALAFGVLHLQFYGLLPRTLLGIILGYMYYWSGSLWVPIFAHFINNAGAVIITWLQGKEVLTPDSGTIGSEGDFWVVGGSLFVTVFILIQFYRYNKYRHDADWHK